MRSLAYFAALLVLLLPARISSGAVESCSDFESEFVDELNAHKQPVCVCSDNGMFSLAPGITIECESVSKEALAKNLQILNGTTLGTLTIRDSKVGKEQKMFANTTVLARVLQVERCEVWHLEADALARMGKTLQQISLRDNLIAKVPTASFEPLKMLKKLDLSSNIISVIEKDAFRGLDAVEDLVLNGNILAELTPGMFNGLTGLKNLNLESCTIQKIHVGAFRGLENLEMLMLTGNQLEQLDPSVLANLKNLRVLDLGSNKLQSIDLKSLPKLEKIVLNNNTIDSMKAIRLRDLPSLVAVMLDRNRLQRLSDADLTGMVRSSRIETLSFAHNNISRIGVKTFQNVPGLKTLLLHHNHITDLSSNYSKFVNDTSPVLSPIKTLGTLQISSNNLTVIRAGELPASLINLALDHNEISRIEPRALEGMSLKRLYLQWNKLQFLYNGAFDSFEPSEIEAIDVSSNAWQCVCKDTKEWLPRWLAEADESDVSEGPIGCLAIPKCGLDEDAPDFVEETEELGGSTRWITIAATILFLVTVILMALIAMLYFKDYRHQFTLRGRRSDSDLHKLIDNDPLNIPTDSILVIPSLPKKPAVAGAPKKTVRFQNIEPHFSSA